MASALYRLGSFTCRRRWWVVGSWLAILVGIGIAAAALKGPTDNTFSVPGTQSQEAVALLDAKFPGTGGAIARIVFAAPAGHTLVESRYKKLVGPTVDLARKVPQTVGGTKAFLGSVQLSKSKKIAYADLHFSVPVAQIKDSTKTALERVAKPAEKAGVQVE